MDKIRKITKRQFDAYCYVRSPFIRHGWQEEEWYEAYDRKLLGAIVLELIDQDFGFVILGRDNTKVFRAIELSTTFYGSVDEAREEFLKAIAVYENDGQELYAQDDEKKVPNEILIAQSPEDKLHKYFKILVNEQRLKLQEI